MKTKTNKKNISRKNPVATAEKPNQTPNQSRFNSLLIISFLLIILIILPLTSAAQCNDGIDNDLDGKIDFPNDNGCDTATDRTEAITLGYASGCLTLGQKLFNVFGEVTYDCDHNHCYPCILMTESGNYSTALYKCYDLEQCSFGGNGTGGGIEADSTPPNVTISSPVQDDIYASKYIPLDIETNEKSDIYYLDNINGRGRWTRVCTDCSSYHNSRNFEEGLNNLTFRATDMIGNEAFYYLSFSVDSKAPKCISSTPLNNEYSNGTFAVKYTEANLNKVELIYIGPADINPITVSLIGCYSGDNQLCTINVNLNAYENSQVSYYFKVCDAASCDECAAQTVKIDSTPPTLTLNTPIPYLNQEKKILFDLEANEPVSMYYIDNNDVKQKQKSLCNNCNYYNKLRSFNDGEWNITIYAEDEVGLTDSENVQFVIDTKVPIIQKTYPKPNSFTNGLFTVIFKEENPKTLTLFYGEDEKPVNLATCSEYKKKYTCDIDISAQIEKYNGQEIFYHFELTDKVGNEAKYKPVETAVDTKDPVLNSLTYEQDDTRIEFTLNITEPNFDEVLYIIDQATDPKARWKTLCTRLKENLCEKGITFKEGTHTVDFQIFDQATNSIGAQETIIV